MHPLGWFLGVKSVYMHPVGWFLGVKSVLSLSVRENGKTYNCDLLVSGPEFAILSIPLPVWVKLGLNSSLNGLPHADSPPVIKSNENTKGLWYTIIKRWRKFLGVWEKSMM